MHMNHDLIEKVDVEIGYLILKAGYLRTKLKELRPLTEVGEKEKIKLELKAVSDKYQELNKMREYWMRGL